MTYEVYYQSKVVDTAVLWITTPDKETADRLVADLRDIGYTAWEETRIHES